MRKNNLFRTVLLSACFASVALVGAACDDGDDGGNDTNADTNNGTSGDGDGDAQCGGDSVYGDQSGCPEYVSCVETNCQTAYETCFGTGYLGGNFGGACADYMNCNIACECGDTACTTECYNMHAAMGSECSNCLVNDIGACVATSCLEAAQTCA